MTDLFRALTRYGRAHRVVRRHRQRGGRRFYTAAVPIVGWFIAPSYGAIAGTLAALEKTSGNAVPE